MATIARCDCGEPGSLTSSGRMVGTTCQESPNLSFSQPHCCALGSPPDESRSQAM
jgi:hypothetical protein